MSVPKLLIAEFGNDKRNNKSCTLSADQSATFHFKADGEDTNLDKYYNLGHAAKQVMIRNNVLATITHIGGQELDFPIRLGTAAANTWRKGIQWTKVTVRADQDATTFEVYGS